MIKFLNKETLEQWLSDNRMLTPTIIALQSELEKLDDVATTNFVANEKVKIAVLNIHFVNDGRATIRCFLHDNNRDIEFYRVSRFNLPQNISSNDYLLRRDKVLVIKILTSQGDLTTLRFKPDEYQKTNKLIKIDKSDDIRWSLGVKQLSLSSLDEINELSIAGIRQNTVYMFSFELPESIMLTRLQKRVSAILENHISRAKAELSAFQETIRQQGKIL